MMKIFSVLIGVCFILVPDDAEFFCGREVFVEELFTATQTRTFIPFLGASGSGKVFIGYGWVSTKTARSRLLEVYPFPSAVEILFMLWLESLVPLFIPDKIAD